jgi:hypothetical protein
VESKGLRESAYDKSKSAGDVAGLEEEGPSEVEEKEEEEESETEEDEENEDEESTEVSSIREW